ncbi:MAG: autotransporter domain-containing protein [Alphaproteobacteria bacterium]|nr:autotransporter domain-containing protein [Alphaproteobacteria bacterium]
MSFGIKASLKITTALFALFSLCPAQAVEVTTWAELSSVGDNDATFANDIEATGTPQTIELNATSPQVVDGGGFSLTGASGYQIRKTAGTDWTIQNFGSVADGTSDDYTYSYQDANGVVIYKKITNAVSAFDGNVFAPNAILLQKFALKDSVFKNNNKQVLNLWLKDVSDTGSIINSVFYGNTNATNEGSIITLTRGTFLIDNIIFDSNSADQGIDFSGGTTTTITNSVFSNNTQNDASNWDEYGTLQLSGGEVSLLDNSQFINNKTMHADGGAISVTGGGLKKVTNTVFKENQAPKSLGGAVWLSFPSSGGGKSLFSNVIFDHNISASGGALVGWDDGKLYIKDSIFTNNSVSGYSVWWGHGFTELGGALLLVDASSTTSNSSFENNAASYGGAVYAAGSPNFTVVDTNFAGNTATEGGALFVDNADAAIIADTKDVTFSENSASGASDTYNAGDDLYFQANNYGTLSLNAAENKKVVFGGTIAAYTGSEAAAGMDINKSGITYNTYDGTTETTVNAGTAGEIQFNNKVGDEEGNIFNIDLYGGTLSIGQNETVNAGVTNPDGFINNNNFSVKGGSTLNTANGVIGEFAPATFSVEAALNYRLDIDLGEVKSDKLVAAEINGGSVTVSSLNIIADSDAPDLKVTYSDTNINGTIKDDYSITTSTATYNVTAENDDSGSHLVLTKSGDVGGGLPAAIAAGSDAYSITDDQDEVVEAWTANDLSADLTINGNNHAITTENGLDGVNVGSSYTLTMNNVSDMSGFNYAVSNEGTVELNNTTIHDNVINDGTLDVNTGVALQGVSGTGTMNINADHELQGTVSGNTINVNGATLSGVDKLASDTTLNAVGGTVDLNNKQATVKEATFDANSTLLVTVNSASDHGSLTAQTMTVADGAKLKATLAQGIVGGGASVNVQLLSAQNADFNNFADSFDNNMYHFEKADKNGTYTITGSATAEDVIRDAGGSNWVANAAKAYVDGPKFENNPVAEKVANQLAALAQNDAQGFITEMKALAPSENAAIQGQVVSNVSRLFKTVDAYLHGVQQGGGLSAGDAFSDVSIWATPYAGKSKINRRGDISWQKSKSLGLIAGIEKKLENNIKMGAGLHYDETDIKQFRRDIDVKTILGFLYGEYKKERFFANSIVSHAWSDYDEHKNALGTNYKADYDVHTSSIALGTGYEFNYITPEVGLHYYHISRDGYTDAAEQHVRGSSSDYLRATMGLRFATEYNGYHPYFYAGVNYDVISPKNNTVVSLVNGTNYMVEGQRLPRTEYALNFGVTKDVTEDLTIGAFYMGAYRKDYQEHTGFIKARYDF